jgi:hypothetical protein
MRSVASAKNNLSGSRGVRSLSKTKEGEEEVKRPLRNGSLKKPTEIEKKPDAPK